MPNKDLDCFNMLTRSACVRVTVVILSVSVTELAATYLDYTLKVGCH